MRTYSLERSTCSSGVFVEATPLQDTREGIWRMCTSRTTRELNFWVPWGSHTSSQESGGEVAVALSIISSGWRVLCISSIFNWVWSAMGGELKELLVKPPLFYCTIPPDINTETQRRSICNFVMMSVDFSHAHTQSHLHSILPPACSWQFMHAHNEWDKGNELHKI